MGKKMFVANLVLLIGILVLLMGVILYFSMGGSFITGFFSGSNPEVISEESKSLASTEHLNIDVSSMSISVAEDAGDQIQIIFSSNQREENRSKITVEEDGGTLTIRQEWKFRFGFFFGMREHLEIRLPASYKGSFSLSASSGDVNMSIPNTFSDFSAHLSSGRLDMKASSITCTSYSIKCTSGSLSVGQLAGSGSMELTSGKLTAEGIIGERHTIKSGSGSMSIETLSGEADVHVFSGRISIDAFSGSGSIRSTSGRLDIGIAAMTGDIDVRSTSGSVHVDIDNDQNFNFEGKTTSGSIHTNFDVSKDGRSTRGSVGDTPQYTLRCDVTSGGIMINREVILAK